LAERVSLRPSEIRSQVSPAMAWRLAVALMLIVAVMMWIQIESGLGEPRRWSVGPFSEARTHCEITDAMLTEVSGMIASRLHPGDLWVHEDSRGDQNLYRLGPNGHVAQTVEVTGFMAQDVEDIAFGPLPDGSMHGIFLADAGDGGADRQVWNLVVLDERDLEGGDAVAPVRVVPVRWPGDVVNGEALVVSPRTGDVYVIEKTAERRPARLYRIARDVWANAEGEAMAQPVGEFDLRRIEAEQSTAISAAEINADGTEIALRTPHFIYVFPLGENLLETLRTEEPLALLLAAHEPKGEALCYDREGRDLFTASEKSLTISRYVREDANSE
jgi:hypothetical protein